MSCVLDASIFGIVLFHETEAEAALQLLRTPGLAAPPQLRTELANLIRRAAKLNGWTVAHAQFVHEDFCKAVGFEPDSAELGRTSLALALELDHAAQDCVYLAVARALRVKLVTADAVFARKARTKGYIVETL